MMKRKTSQAHIHIQSQAGGGATVAKKPLKRISKKEVNNDKVSYQSPFIVIIP